VDTQRAGGKNSSTPEDLPESGRSGSMWKKRRCTFTLRKFHPLNHFEEGWSGKEGEAVVGQLPCGGGKERGKIFNIPPDQGRKVSGKKKGEEAQQFSDMVGKIVNQRGGENSLKKGTGSGHFSSTKKKRAVEEKSVFPLPEGKKKVEAKEKGSPIKRFLRGEKGGRPGGGGKEDHYMNSEMLSQKKKRGGGAKK